ncbi:unnamed protein product [Arctia plantaginis]|uniref:Uncharacterized protein n=1 Tax=Arctia plantaginis TaxID=874455 RepID=A0A8S1ADS5_ARCPL|nr:unnamed protein product [Arctia plantaginis]
MNTNKSSFSSKTSYSSKNTKPCLNKTCNPYKSKQRKVIPSKKLSSNGNDTKSCSTSVVSTKKSATKPKRVTASDVVVTKKTQTRTVDYCKKCGDTFDKNAQKETKITEIVSAINAKTVRNDNTVTISTISSPPIQQYYKNKNFVESTESVEVDDGKNKNKNRLDTIKEVSELHAISDDLPFIVYSDSDEDITYLDPDDEDNIKKLKRFRNENYFECHSAKARIRSRGSVTSLNNHKCVYRFYLNDRLFPVPLNTDYDKTVRCVECHLPMDIKNNCNDDKINGTIQAKVKFGKETQDVILLLPIKESLIIKERRKEEREIIDEYVYFGVVKLGTNGNSIFNSTLPEDSLALKYQKGYKEYGFDNRYTYKNINENDVIII